MLQLFFTIGGELQRNVISSLLQQVNQTKPNQTKPNRTEPNWTHDRLAWHMEYNNFPEFSLNLIYQD